MRILTHNSLKCPAKNINVGYPLGLEITDMEIVESEFNPEFIKGILPSLDWSGVLVAAKAVGLEELPSQFDMSLLTEENFLLAMHNLLLDVHVKTGVLTCPESGRKFPIENGRADMM